MPYYVLWTGEPELVEVAPGDVYPGDEAMDLDGGDWGGVEDGDFTNGAKLPREPSTPIHIDTFGSGVMPPAFVVPALVVRRDFAEALRGAGVDNVDYYPAVLHDRDGGRQWDDYFVANVLGLIDAVDTRQSIVSPGSPPGLAALFEKLVVDEAKCRGVHFFRLAQKPSMLLASQRVRDHVLSSGFKHVAFVPPEEFA